MSKSHLHYLYFLNQLHRPDDRMLPLCKEYLYLNLLLQRPQMSDSRQMIRIEIIQVVDFLKCR